ncbi:peroxiredoxin [Guyparkeria sp. 1SP6A2]|nr:peroxiredoxin [Guyparkeria sp. 1SP6A2]
MNTSPNHKTQPAPREGDPAPAFEGRTTEGHILSLADFAGHPLVLYFYPRDNTPGCTTEARDFQANLPAVESLAARVVGVSNDDATSHRKFCDKQGLSFSLIADTDHTVSQAFDVLRMKNMFGKRFEGIERSTFLIDGDGVVRRAWRKVKVPGHVDEVLDALRNL